MMPLARAQIAALIPHSGTMCLLDEVLRWDAASIRCLSRRHRAPDNPLRRADGLGMLAGVEFAAQAMAVHGRLSAAAGETPKAGYLASLREVTCREGRLDLLEAPLIVLAERLAGDERQALYRFAVECGGEALLAGRAAVLLAPPPS
jgi:predicted hotdog family 3-hydroxylacyl-ACP dehydratase